MQKKFALILLVLTLFSITIPSVEINHNCTGDDCAICYVIHVAEENLKLLKITAAALITASAAYRIISYIFKYSQINHHYSNNLITQKIRLND